jgi:HD-like signal output (HDOD) protein
MTTLNLTEVVSKIHDLPSLPAVVVELLESIDRENLNANALAVKVSHDQALAGKTLRLANSAFYGSSGKVTTIQEAVAVLGIRNV